MMSSCHRFRRVSCDDYKPPQSKVQAAAVAFALCLALNPHTHELSLLEVY